MSENSTTQATPVRTGQGAWVISKESLARITTAVAEARDSERATLVKRVQAVALIVQHGAVGAAPRPYLTWKAVAEAMGVSGASITIARRLAKAMDLGLTPEHAAWPVVSSRAGTKEVGEALAADKPTMTKVIAAARKADSATRQQVSSTTDTRTPRPNETPETPETPKDTRSPLQVAMEALAILDDTAKALSDEDWTKVQTRLAKVIQRENLNRAHKAKATPAKATPATVAKATAKRTPAKATA